MIGWLLFYLTVLILFSVVAFFAGLAIGVKYNNVTEPVVLAKDVVVGLLKKMKKPTS